MTAVRYSDSNFSLGFLLFNLVMLVTKCPVHPVSGVINCGGVQARVFEILFVLFTFKHNAAP